MANHRVVWEIDVDADSPEEAARKAREIQQRSDNDAGVYEVLQQPAGQTLSGLLPQGVVKVDLTTPLTFQITIEVEVEAMSLDEAKQALSERLRATLADEVMTMASAKWVDCTGDRRAQGFAVLAVPDRSDLDAAVDLLVRSGIDCVTAIHPASLISSRPVQTVTAEITGEWEGSDTTFVLRWGFDNGEAVADGFRVSDK